MGSRVEAAEMPEIVVEVSKELVKIFRLEDAKTIAGRIKIMHFDTFADFEAEHARAQDAGARSASSKHWKRAAAKVGALTKLTRNLFTGSGIALQNTASEDLEDSLDPPPGPRRPYVDL